MLGKKEKEKNSFKGKPTAFPKGGSRRRLQKR